ncbi:hypothetical protein O181_028187 [Austropuccinia psidii MF-1]|uniref:Uncharacterized protein n=1 Tax=Austropuccinia psidii MF-1 TaxID=1389203 RepID=A0A9Q3H2C9_9BASI|nr:hypothetical protein [Austropuccinia psidii MF-1]
MMNSCGTHSWPWRKEKNIPKWDNDSWRLIMENPLEGSIFNIERDRPMSWFIKNKDRLTSLHPDMFETMLLKRILRIFVGDLEHSIICRYITPFSTEYHINSIEDINPRIKIGRNLHKPPTENNTSGKPLS